VTPHGLERVVAAARARRQPDQTCELCATPIPDRHAHLLDNQQHTIVCACIACSLLFAEQPEPMAQPRQYRLIPRHRRRLRQVPVDLLSVPVGLAFFIRRDDGTVLAHYPSPAGATQWAVDAAAWAEVLCRCPEVASVLQEVEALLVNTARGRQDFWILPVDDCYRLVAVVRREWRGLSGGSRVWPEIDRFFDELTERH
jgi:hypothetical protein